MVITAFKPCIFIRFSEIDALNPRKVTIVSKLCNAGIEVLVPQRLVDRLSEGQDRHLLILGSIGP